MSAHHKYPKNSASKKIGVIGAPVWRGQKKLGVDYGPKILRDEQLLEDLIKLGHTVTDFGDITTDVVDSQTLYNVGRLQYNMDYIRCETTQLKTTLESSLSQNDVCIVLGGDHTISVGSILGHARAAKQLNKDVILLYIDAHADINTLKTSPTASLHGAVLPFVLKEMERFSPRIPSFENCPKPISASRMAYMGLRSVDPYERYFIDALHIPAYSMACIDSMGVKSAIQDAITTLTQDNERCSLHVSFDIDVVDPVYAPATGVPVPGGLTVREILTIAEEIHKTGLLRVLDITEINPLCSNPMGVRSTANVAKRVAMSLLGDIRIGTYPIPFDESLVTP